MNGDYQRNLLLALGQAENILLLAAEFAKEGAQDDTTQPEIYADLETKVQETLGQLYMVRGGVRKLQGEQRSGYDH